MKKLKSAAFSLVLLTSVLVQGTASAQTATYNEELSWDVTPATTAPKNMQDIKKLLETGKNKKIFANVDLRSGKEDTLSFYFVQYLDHTGKADPKKENALWQRVYITKYLSADNITVMHTGGYKVDSSTVSYYDLAKELNANMIQVEHRYTGVSHPDEDTYAIKGGILNNKNYWDFCTADQSAYDLAYVVNTLKKIGIFKGKWVSTGTSKCGMTTTFLAMYHPETCDAYVPFCAPFCPTLQEPLDHYVYAEYGGRLARHDKQDSIIWDRSWLPVKDYLENPYIKAPLNEKLKERYKGKYNLSSWTDKDFISEFVTLFYGSQWDKATYFQVRNWKQLIPSRLAKDNANPSPQYVDSMFTYLTANDDTLYNHMYDYLMGTATRRVHHSDNPLSNLHRQRYAIHRAGEANDGIDEDIYNADEYYIQTLYELGHHIADFSYVYSLIGKEMYQTLTRNSLTFNYPGGCPKVAQNIGLYTESAFYTNPKDPSGPALNIARADNAKPFMPKNPIAPAVREFIKTTKAPILFVYGEFDPWTQAGITDAEVKAAGNPNVQRFEVPSGTHNQNVRDVLNFSSDYTAGQTIVNKVKDMLNKVPTAIRNVTTATAPTAADNAIYDLQGRRVTSPTRKGLYIQNGRKVILR